MSLPLPKDFHVETPRVPRCANSACGRKIGSEKAFCSACWGRLSKGVRERITTCHATRNKAGLLSNIRRALTEIRTADAAKTAKAEALKLGQKGGIR
jgi:hypothetical protein